MSDDHSKPRGFLASLAVFTEWRILIMLGLGFAAGLPNLLIFDTLSAWLRDAGYTLQIISFFGLVTLVYSFKFLWAPLVDRTTIPRLTTWLGHRRSWMLVTQTAIIAGLVIISSFDPKSNLVVVAVFAALTGFSSATQDIVIDAWRIEAADLSRQGAMAAAYQWGYRIAIIVAGAVPLFLADVFGWNISYGLMAALMTIGIGAVLMAPAEKAHTIRPIPTVGIAPQPGRELAEWVIRLVIISIGALLLGTGLAGRDDILVRAVKMLGSPAAADCLHGLWSAPATGDWCQLAVVLAGFTVIVISAWPLPGIKTRPGVYLSHALGDPLSDFFKRSGKMAGLILALICLYRLSDFVLNIMTPFYLDLGFTKTEVAEVRKIFGVPMSMIGVFLGGWAVARFGIMRPLIAGAFTLPFANSIFSWLAIQGPDMTSLFVTIGVDNIVSGYAGTCLVAYMSSLTSAGFTATQYALFSSLYSLPGKLIASQSGRIVETAAHAAEPGGSLAFLRKLFAHTPLDAFAVAMAKSHVSPAALGSGYVVFFFYSGLVGVAAMVIVLLVARQEKRAKASS